VTEVPQRTAESREPKVSQRIVATEALGNESTPQTPFAEFLVTETEGEAALRGTTAQTPFVTAYFAGEQEEHVDPRAGEMVQLLDELYDAEFDELLYELADDVQHAYQQQFEFEYSNAASQDSAGERFVAGYLSGLQEEAERHVDEMMQAAVEHDPAGMTERELDNFLAQFEVRDTALSPLFEDFLGKWVGKIKNVVKAGVKLAGRLSPIHMILGRLKRLVKPLLNRVLRFALDKLPPALRPAASQLANRLLGKLQSGADDASAQPAQPAAADVSQLQREFDLGAASLLLASDDTEGEVALAETVTEMERADSDALAELDQARERFISEITNLDEGEDPTPVIQNFLPAVLPALRLGIKLVGRPKVVTLLAGILANRIQRFVGRQASQPLSQAIVDAGLRLLSLEVTPEVRTRAAGSAMATAVEDTVRRVAELDEAVLDSQPLLEAAAAEAFDAAAASNFPSELLVPELREAETGAWVLFPLRGRPRYKRFTQVLDTRITPMLARHIRTFGGTTLDVVLRDRYGITGPVAAQARLYEAIPGSSLARIAGHEQEIAGSGAASPAGWSELHPLTPEAAGLLFQSPGLGREVPQAYLSDPSVVATGQRFYQLEMPSARPAAARPAPAGRGVRRSTRLSISFRFKADEIRVRLFLSEADAQSLAARVGKGAAAAGPLTRMLLARIDAGVRDAFSGRYPRRLRFVHEAVPQDYLMGSAVTRLPEPLRQWLTTLLRRWLHATVTERFVERHGRQLQDAAANTADGVTVVIDFKAPPGMKLVAGALRGQTPGPRELVPPAGGPPQATVRIVPGRQW
jgi:hypothetical protein